MCVLLKDSHENQTSNVNLGFTVNQKWLGGLAHRFVILFIFILRMGGLPACMYMYHMHAVPVDTRRGCHTP